jgi:hypothetical protein
MIRPYENKDYETIEDMLITEGIPHYQQCFTLNGYYTYALEEDNEVRAFFTLKQEKDCLSLQHFCVKRKYRAVRYFSHARRLMEGVKKTVRDMGYTRYIIHPEEDYLDKLVQKYCKQQPYAIRGLKTFYEVQV